MTTEELKALFQKHADAPLYVNVCGDLCAMRLLQELAPDTRDMVACAEHDQIWLRPDLGDLAGMITEEQVEYLCRCGVWIDNDVDSLSMFV